MNRIGLPNHFGINKSFSMYTYGYINDIRVKAFLVAKKVIIQYGAIVYEESGLY